MVLLYADGRGRMLALGREAGDDGGATPVPACPAWTVKDAFAHQAGVAADVLAGRLESVATDPWTARQVAERADRSLTEICEEWAESGPRFDDVLRTLGEAADPRLALDQWTHEQDVRGALGRVGARELPVVGFIVDTVLGRLGRDVTDAGLPALRVIGSSREWTIGDSTPAATVRASDFELARALIGRRTDDQIRAYQWDGDPEPYLLHLSVFPRPVTAFTE